MKLIYIGSRVTKLKASFALDNNAQLLVYQRLKSLYFLDGHASNISIIDEFKGLQIIWNKEL
jgi:hypothetical protein